jgi:NitT/TauT family transport system substrate-binding protein
MKNVKNRLIALALAVSLALPIFTSCGKKEEEKSPLKIGYAGSLCEAPLHIAYEKGYFEKEGLEVEFIKIAPGTAYDMITAGSIEACFALLAGIITPLANGLPAKITSGLHTGCDVVLVKSDSGLTKPTDLRGKTVGVPSMTTSPIIYTKRVLADNGVDITAEKGEVDFAVYNQTDLALILSNGDVDAIALNEPLATIAKNEYGYVELMNSAFDEPYNEQYCCVSYVRDSVPKDVALKFTKAMQEASIYVQSNQDEVAQIQVDKNYVAGDPKVNAEVLKTLYYIPSAKGAYDAFAITAPQLQDIGLLEADVNIDALQKNSFLLFTEKELPEPTAVSVKRSFPDFAKLTHHQLALLADVKVNCDDEDGNGHCK